MQLWKTVRRWSAVVLASLIAAWTAAAHAPAHAASQAASPGTRPAAGAVGKAYVCPMYDFSSDQPGLCPNCRMTLVPAASVPPPPPADNGPVQAAAYVCSNGDGTEDAAPGRCLRCGAALVSATRDLSVAILVFPGVQIIDYTGPFEVFGQGRCNTFLVAKSRDAVTTAMGMKVSPAHSFADCPHVDVLVIPGGNADTVETDAEAIRWLRARAGEAQFVMSVCNGAFILAKTGLLDGLDATTFYDLLDEFALRYPKVHAVRDRRFVDNGKYVATAGISSGIDGALHVIGKLRGQGTAQRVALNMEYDWRPAGDYARASLADGSLRSIFGRNLRLRVIEGVAPLLAHTQGDRDHWEVEWSVLSTLAATELLARLDRTVEERGRWARIPAAGASASAGDAGGVRSRWRFADGDVMWQGVTEIVPSDGTDRYRVRVRVDKA